MQLTNAGLEICWKRVVRMHWRAGAAKERPASILRDVYACRRVYGRRRGWLEVLICKQKQQSPKQKPGAHGDLPRELSLHGSELASQGLAGFVRVTWEHFSLPFSLLRYTMPHCLGELTLVLLQWQGECVMYLCCWCSSNIAFMSLSRYLTFFTDRMSGSRLVQADIDPQRTCLHSCITHIRRRTQAQGTQRYDRYEYMTAVVD